MALGLNKVMQLNARGSGVVICPNGAVPGGIFGQREEIGNRALLLLLVDALEGYGWARYTSLLVWGITMMALSIIMLGWVSGEFY